ncbi:glycoside hydrolase family 18 protein [Achlya hypogyna]|uniref:Glycoside hydrolase family 18 protein n=1 Tax=Achlya hypogyna TaxID=1202772 RepID=A0A1V9YVX1_ACHHY|nr:glycoside hydrolase family 18 protein [Achlya hypogyna]
MLTKSFLPVVALAAAVAARPGLKNVVYFMEWSIYARNFHMFDLDWSRITHVNYAFGKPNADGTVQLYDTWSATDKRYLDHGDSWNDVGNNVYGQFGLGNKMKRQYRHTKFGLSIGGWTLSGLFSGIASTEAGRRTFAKSAVEQMLHLGLDFIDIDWEYPVQGGNAIPHSPNDMKNFVALLQAIRDAFASLPFQAELSVASPAGPENYVHWDFPAVCGLVDHVNLMAYDLAGSWSEYTDYQNNLYADPSHPSGKQYSIDKAVQDYIAGGCASDKIVMGIPLYGRSFEGTAGLYQPFAPPTAGSWVSGGDGAGVWDYKILPRPGATEYYDAKVGAGYSYNPNTRVFTSRMEAFYLKFVVPSKDYALTECMGGPRPFQLRHLMNAHKGTTIPVYLLLMYLYDNWSVPAFVILANQGTYGLAWILKDQIFPDRTWNTYMTIPSFLMGIVAFGTHWCGGFLLISRHVAMESWVLAVCIGMHTLGLVLMMCTDTQKYFLMRYKPGLISEGWVKWCRNTNFFGEFLVYLSYAIMGQHWFPYVFLAFMWLFVGISNMLVKDASLRKKDGGVVYLQQSGFFFPNISGWAMSSTHASATVLPSPYATPSEPGPTLQHVPTPQVETLKS